MMYVQETLAECSYTLIFCQQVGSLQNLDSGLDYGLTALLNYLGSDQYLS